MSDISPYLGTWGWSLLLIRAGLGPGSSPLSTHGNSLCRGCCCSESC